mgnify:CR=1 FL=1
MMNHQSVIRNHITAVSTNAAFVAKLPIVKCSTRHLKLHGCADGIKYGDDLSDYININNYILKNYRNMSGGDYTFDTTQNLCI